MVFIGNHDFSVVVEDHRAWLLGFEDFHLMKWNRELQRNPESALCEAMTRQMLIDNGCEVSPNDTPTEEKSADFLCRIEDYKFFVEVTCCSREKITEKTGIDEELKVDAYWVGPLAKYISRSIRAKANKFDDVEYPGIVVFGIFHQVAGMICFEDYHIQQLLVGSSALTIQSDEHGNIGSTREVLTTENTIFLNATSEGLDYKRQQISAAILCSFAGSRRLRGIINPEASRPFNTDMLRGIPFCKVHIEDNQPRIE